MSATLPVILFDGMAFGMLLFLVSVGLSITMGMMGFINLAHGAFAMLGGYLATVLMHRAGWPFLATLPAVFVGIALVSAVIERTLYRRLYARSALDQVLFTVGVTYMVTAGVTWYFGPAQQPVVLPAWLQGQTTVLGVALGTYRLFLVGFGVFTAVAVVLGIERTRLGARIRASVDNPVMAAGLGISVGAVFAITFAIGSGLAGVGGALAIQILGLDPSFAVRYLVFCLVVVAVGGAGSTGGTLLAACIVGIFDVAGKYFLPQTGAFTIYAVMVGLLMWRPQGLLGRTP